MTSSDPPWWRDARPATRATWLQEATTVVGLAGLALYALLRISYDRFYARFHLSPDDLGLGYLELLAQAAVGALVLLAAHALLAFVLVSVYSAIGTSIVRSIRRRVRGEGAEPGARSRMSPVDRIAAAGIVVLVLVAPVDAVTGLPLLEYGLLVVLVAGLAGSNIMFAIRGTQEIRVALRGRRRAYLLAALTALGFLVVSLTGYTLISGANEDADAVKDGRATRSVLFGLRLTSWGADAARLAWTTDAVDPALRPLDGACVMYLGQSDGTLFVYKPDATGPATFRVPASMAAVRLVERCP